MTHSHVRFQVDPGSAPLLPAWMEEVAAVAHVIKETGVLAAIGQKVQFARDRFGVYETIDFVIVLFSYALSGEQTFASFYDRVSPLIQEFLALLPAHDLPSC